MIGSTVSVVLPPLIRLEQIPRDGRVGAQKPGQPRGALPLWTTRWVGRFGRGFGELLKLSCRLICERPIFGAIVIPSRSWLLQSCGAAGCYCNLQYLEPVVSLTFPSLSSRAPSVLGFLTHSETTNLTPLENTVSIKSQYNLMWG